MQLPKSKRGWIVAVAAIIVFCLGWYYFTIYGQRRSPTSIDILMSRDFERDSRNAIAEIRTYIIKNEMLPEWLDFLDDLFEDLEEASFELLQLSETTLVFISTFRGEIFTRVFEILPDGSVDVREK